MLGFAAESRGGSSFQWLARYFFAAPLYSCILSVQSLRNPVSKQLLCDVVACFRFFVFLPLC